MPISNSAAFKGAVNTYQVVGFCSFIYLYLKVEFDVEIKMIDGNYLVLFCLSVCFMFRKEYS